MGALVYTRYELLRTIRNRRFFILSFGFPLIIYLLVAGPNRGVHDINGTGLSAPLYFMIGWASFGTMNAMVSCGARIAAERQAGWTRQLRISPLSTRAYFRAKVLTAYMMALISLLALYAAGASMGVRLSASGWLGMTGLILVGLIPFAGLGVTLGHLFTPDSIGPVIGGGVSLLGLLGGTFFPLGHGGFLSEVAQYLPSYWLVQAAHVGAGGSGWPAKAWIVVAAWTVAMSLLAARAYKRDSGRV
ncbi:MAG TPA: ABC transporter permease [Solirubrobacteraceae bacterium]|jgi:ABC-2 type transport system permease protein|nr:ABC transporter permease [Solirubrobacteraceae bacterium]